MGRSPKGIDYKKITSNFRSMHETPNLGLGPYKIIREFSGAFCAKAE